MLWQFWLLYYTFRNMHKSVLAQRSVGRGPGFSCELEYPVVFCRGGHSLSFNRSHIFFSLTFPGPGPLVPALMRGVLGPTLELSKSAGATSGFWRPQQKRGDINQQWGSDAHKI